MRLEGRTAIVTGAGSGIGRAAACLFAHEGARIVAVDIDADAGARTRNEIEASGGEAIAVASDVTHAADVRRMAEVAIVRFGRIDILYVILTMPGLIEGRVFGAKLVASRASPDPAAGPRITAFVLLFDVRANAPRGLVAAAHLTDLRTAAGLAAATKVLAREDCRTLAVFGAGRLALPSIELVCHVRPIDRLFVVGRSRAPIEALARTVTARLGSRLTAIVTDALPAAAAAAADVIVTVTSSGMPVFDGRAVRPGTHLNLGGAFRADTREVDDAVASRAVFFVDGLESCLARAGDLVLPMREGALARSAVRGEIGAVLGGQLAGRQRPDEITVFKSLGSAVQDLVLGARLLARAEQRGLGLRFDPG